jgi:hypothetical protein
MSWWLLGAVLASSTTVPAIAGSAYSKCVEAAEPAECIARRAVGSFGLESGEVLEAVLRHGLVDIVPDKSAKLMRGLYGRIGEPDEKMDTPEEQILDSSAAQALRDSPRKSVLAAMALVAAARRDINPFAHPVYLKLAREAKDDPRISALALALWIEIVGMSGSPPDFRVTHVGLKGIWDRAVARKEKDVALLEDMARALAFLNELKPQAQEFFVWYAQRTGLTPYQRVAAASRLARFFDLPDIAAALIEGIEDDVEGYDVPAVRGEVAAARLARGYHAESARLLMRVMLDDLTESGGRFSSVDEYKRVALERSAAREELRMLGSECLRRAEGADDNAAASNWYAAASDLYLRAGDRELAQEIARRGLPYVPGLVWQATESLGEVDRNNPTAMAIAVQGTGTAPVIALYRAGAIQEALKTQYLTGKDRYLNAERAGEKKDPQWVLDDGWPLYVSAMAGEAERSTSREFQQRAYDRLVRSCGKPLADCFAGTLRQIAQAAAGMGDEQRMKGALTAAARQLDKDVGMAFAALYVAGPWAHCAEVLRAAQAGSE